MERFNIFSNDIYEMEMSISLNTLKRFRKVWIGKNKGFSSDELFKFANEEFYCYRYMVSQAEKEAQRMIVRIFKRLFDCDEYKMKFTESYSFRTPYQFIVEDDAGKRIGYRFEEFCDSEDENVAAYLEEFNLDSFSILLLRKENSKVKETFNLSNPKITVCLMVEFFKKYFSLDEYKNFRDKLDEYLIESNDAMGYKSIPFLSTMNLAILKNMEKEKLDDWKFQNTRYQILNRNNKELFENVMAYVEKYNVPSLLFGIMEKTFKTNGINSLLGTNDFAKSFITSEWLYEIFKRKKHFDYTVIISGYLKSIEQLLYNIALLHSGESGMLISVDDISNAKKAGINIIQKNKGKNRINFCEKNKRYMKICIFRQNSISVPEGRHAIPLQTAC